MESADVLILSDYGKGVIGAKVAPRPSAPRAKLGKPIVVDSKGGAIDEVPRRDGAHAERSRRRARREHPYRERLRSRSRPPPTVGSHRRCGAADHPRRGRDDLFWTGEPIHIPTEAREVYDVTGAGDTVVAALRSRSRRRAVAAATRSRLANAAAGIVVGKVGTSTVSLAELEERGAEI